LDKDTSGLMVVAASERAMTALAAQLAARTMSRRYLAFVHGSAPASGSIDAAIGRDPSMRLRMAVIDGPNGKAARTHFRRLSAVGAAAGTISLVECRLETGRTHQIRVHLASIGHPIVGDELYGGSRGAIARQALHAWRLGLVDPGSMRAMRWCSVPPSDMQALAATIGLEMAQVCRRLDAEIANDR
jgi:23S rRNA pseudouridine1911/1915/1917 synthase